MPNTEGESTDPTCLAVNPRFSIKTVNVRLKASGYILKSAGFCADWGWPIYRYDRLPNTKHKVLDPFVRVYHIGDYTLDDWDKLLLERLRATSSAAYKRALEKRQRARDKIKKKERK